jgi:hypothetical protein
MNFRIGDRGGGHQIADSSGKLNFVVGFADFGVHLGVHVVSTEARNRVHSSEMVEESENSESCEPLDSM